MALQTERVGDTLVVRVGVARLDAHTASNLKSEVGPQLGSDCGRLVVNLESVTFIDSSGLGAIVALRRAMDERGTVALCGLTDATRPILRLTSMDQVFELHETEAQALGREA